MENPNGNYLCSHLFLRFKIRQCVYACRNLQGHLLTLCIFCMVLLFNNQNRKQGMNFVFTSRFYIGGSIIFLSLL